jgi:UDP-N-acetyl-D-mannosaminuronate dehydrogenase
VKESAFSGVFPLVTELEQRGATALVHDPMFNDEELTVLGFKPFHFGDKADAAIIQADHKEYLQITSNDIPGVSVLFDGRNMVHQIDGIQIIGIGR